MYLIQGRAQFVERTIIPAVIKIESQDVRDVSKPAFFVFLHVSVTGNHSEPGRIGLTQCAINSPGAIIHFFEIIPLLVFTILPGRIVQKHFVHVCPGDHGRVIIILINHLSCHIHGVAGEIIGQADAVHDRNLHTGEDSKAVTFVRYQFILRVMGNPEEVAAHIL